MSKRTAGLKSVGARKQGAASARSKAQPGPGLRKNAHTSTQAGRVKGQSFYRSDNTIRRLKMYTQKPDMDKMRKTPAQQAIMIEPGRKWFSNTRVVSQEKLQQFREALEAKAEDPSSILIKRTKLPVSLFDHSNEQVRKRTNNLLAVEPFEEVFGTNKRQKRPKLEVTDLDQLAATVERQTEAYTDEPAKDKDIAEENPERDYVGPVEAVMLKGTSKRIWGELYKVVDSSDVIVQVLDARDPMGTRCQYLERHIKKDRPFKHIVLLLNKCDLIPTHMTERWVKVLSREFPTVAFKASITHPFGKKNFIGLLRQFAEKMKNRKHVSVGFIGYPNVGKSSVINALKSKKVCVAAPVPGETKVWQYVALTSKVYLIDCPGIVIAGGAGDDVTKVLKGVVRAEKLEAPEDYVQAVVDLVTPARLNKHYEVEEDWSGAEEFLTKLAIKFGKLRKGGLPDISVVAKKVLNDFQRGQLPYFIAPPKLADLPTPKKRQSNRLLGLTERPEEEDDDDIDSQEGSNDDTTSHKSDTGNDSSEGGDDGENESGNSENLSENENLSGDKEENIYDSVDE